MTLEIQIKKNGDGTAALSCQRADGSTTWQRHKLGHAEFFVRHDLTHLAVESELSQLVGFYRLIAMGWEIGDFAPPWPKGALPPSAAFIEVVVGLLDNERASGTLWTAEDFNLHVENHRKSRGLDATETLSDSRLARIRRGRSELFAAWDRLHVGERLELRFSR